MRVPLAATLESRDGTVDQDAVVKNGIVETRGESSAVRKRPGLSDIGLMRAGVAQALTYWNSRAVGIVDDYLTVGVVAEYTTSTIWNSADKTADVTLSGSDLVAQTNTAGSAGGVRSVASVSSGLWYFEATVNDFDDVYFGLANSSKVLTASPAAAGSDALTYHRSGAIQFGNTSVASATSFGNGVVIALLLDVDARTVKFYRANVLQATVTSAQIPTGALFAYFGSAAVNGTSQITANFGAVAFTYTVPGLSSTSITPTTADLQFSMQDNGSNAPGGSLLMFKNREQAWYANTTPTVTQVTDVDYPGKYAVTLTALTRSSTTATATTPTDTNFQVGGSVVIAGVNEAGWNGTYTITAVTPSTSTVGDDIPITITRSGTTATATCTSTPHGFASGATVTISGADQAEYNGAKSITVTSTTAFTFAVTVSGADYVTPATGTLGISLYGTGHFAAGEFSVSSQVATLYFPGPHLLASGRTISIVLSYPSSSGITTFYGDALAITSTGDRTLTVAVSGVPDVSRMLSNAPYGASISAPQAGIGVTSITSDGVTATVTTTAAHYFVSGLFVSIFGAAQPYYNNYAAQVTVTGVSTFTYPISVGSGANPATPATGTITANSGGSATGASFTFTVDGTETTPATGTITATSGRNTVPGIAYMDGYFVVMDVNGVVYNSAIDNPGSWNALEYITAQAETGAGKFLGRSQSYIVALKEWSTEFFYNAGNPIGSPFSPVPNAFTQVGCASGESVATIDKALIWISQSRKKKGRSVHMMDGMQQAPISTEDVERVLNADDLAEVYAYGVTLDGHPLYILTLVTSNITLVYDLKSQTWGQWTSLTLGSQVSVSTITRSGTTATVTTGSAHDFSDGDPVKVSGASQSDYNGTFQISYISTTSFSIEVSNSPATPATGTILAYPYTETYWKFTHYATGAGRDFLLHKSDGHLYEFSSALYQDNAIPVNFFMRTARLDGAETRLKKMPRITLIGDKQSDTAMIRWSDDDSATFSAYRRVDLSDAEPMLRRCGSFRRRSLEVRHTGNTAERFGSLELEVSQ